jgi:hypothetical protein
MNPWTRATVAAASAAVLAVAGLYGPRWLAVAVLALSFVLAIGWPVLTWTPHWIAGSAITLGAGALSVVGVLLGRDEPFLRHMVIALAASTVAALIVEVLYPSPAGQVVTAVAGTVTGATVAASGAAWIATARTPGAEDLVVAGALALAVSAIASVVTTRMSINVALALTLSVGVGIGSGSVFPSITWYGGALIGFLAASSFIAVHELTRREITNTSVWAGIASGVAPVTLGGALIYIGGRILVG